MTDHARPQQTPPSSLVPAALEPYVDPSVVDGATSFDISAVDFHGDAAPATIGFTSPSGDSLKNPRWYQLATHRQWPTRAATGPSKAGLLFFTPTPYTATHANACIAATKATQPFHRISHHSSLSAVPRPPRS